MADSEQLLGRLDCISGCLAAMERAASLSSWTVASQWLLPYHKMVPSTPPGYLVPLPTRGTAPLSMAIAPEGREHLGPFP